MTELPLIPPPPSSPIEPGFVVLGRFQPFHRGHALMLQEAEQSRNENFPDLQLIIAIGSSNCPETLRNPWSASERTEMISSWLDIEAEFDAIIVSIPDIDDPPNWVSHAEKYHGKSGVFFSSDSSSCNLYKDSGWEIISMPLVQRENFEGWRVRETARMLSTIYDKDAIDTVLGASIPQSVINYLFSNDYLKRLAFLGEGGEPVG
jgi:nicotinamide-nucleotide adenylyltransferase